MLESGTPRGNRKIQSLRDWIASRSIAPAAAAILGFFANPLLELRTGQILSAENMAIALFFIFGAFTIVAAIHYGHILRLNSSVAATSQDILKLLGQDAQLLPFDDAYRQLAKWADEAQDEILLLTNYFEKPHSSVSSLAKDRQASPARVEWFDAAERAIQRAVDGDSLRFFRMLQVDTKGRPSDQDISWLCEKLRAEPQQLRLSESLLDRTSSASDQVLFKVGSIKVPHTFLLIDKKYLWMNLDSWDTDEGTFNSRLVLIAKDDTGRQFRTLRELFFRICHSNDSVLLERAAWQSTKSGVA
jgi:hypothetical protein